jgi:protoporphyrinogen oxidase
VNGFVNQFGDLTGLKDLIPPLRLSFSPYVTTGYRSAPQTNGFLNEWLRNGGMDVKYGLSESIINPASEFIKSNCGEIILSELVKEVVIKNQKIVSIKSENKIYDNFDYVISAIPLYALEKIIPKTTLNINLELEYSTILNIHIWLKENNLNDKFYGLLDSTLHWIFVKENHVNIVISDANYLADKSKEEIYDLVTEELLQFTSINRENILKYKIIKEKRATFVPAIETLNMRPNSRTSIKNLFLAGDWTNTGLPSTIESAVKSGRIAADFILNEAL